MPSSMLRETDALHPLLRVLVGRRVLVKRNDLENFLEANPIEPRNDGSHY